MVDKGLVSSVNMAGIMGERKGDYKRKAWLGARGGVWGEELGVGDCNGGMGTVPIPPLQSATPKFGDSSFLPCVIFAYESDAVLLAAARAGDHVLSRGIVFRHFRDRILQGAQLPQRDRATRCFA